MLCNECKKNEANVHIITEVNGRRVEEHLCSECAAKLNKINTDNIFAGFFGLSPMRKMFSLMSGGDVSDMAREFFGVQPEKSEQPKELDEIAKRRALIAEAIKEDVSFLKINLFILFIFIFIQTRVSLFTKNTIKIKYKLR